jgi:hypothetical protein
VAVIEERFDFQPVLFQCRTLTYITDAERRRGYRESVDNRHARFDQLLF